MPHRSRHAKTRRGNFRVAALGKKLLCNNVQPLVFLRRKLLVANMRQFALFKSIKRQVDFRSAHVPGENHRASSSLPTPLASGGGSNAAASLSSSNSNLPFFG